MFLEFLTQKWRTCKRPRQILSLSKLRVGFLTLLKNGDVRRCLVVASAGLLPPSLVQYDGGWRWGYEEEELHSAKETGQHEACSLVELYWNNFLVQRSSLVGKSSDATAAAAVGDGDMAPAEPLRLHPEYLGYQMGVAMKEGGWD
eukprot:jgi/Bigna1/128241/aug1.6_g2949